MFRIDSCMVYTGSINKNVGTLFYVWVIQVKLTMIFYIVTLLKDWFIQVHFTKISSVGTLLKAWCIQDNPVLFRVRFKGFIKLPKTCTI